MPSGISFWKRLGQALRVNRGPTNGNGRIEQTGETIGRGAQGVDAAAAGTSAAASLLPWNRRQKSLEQLRAGYERLLELVDAMHTHFNRQDRRAEELAAGIDRIGNTLVQLAETQRAQGECIAVIADQVDQAAKHSAKVATTLLELPAAVQAQTEAVRLVGRQMEAAREADARFLEHFSQAAESLRTVGSAQVELLQRLHETSTRQREAWESFARGQTRLLLTITVVVVVLGLGVIGALAVAARMVFSP